MPKHIYPVRPLPADIIADARSKYDASVLGRGLCEMRLVWNLIHDLRAAGLAVGMVNNGDEDTATPTERMAFDEVFAVDEAWLLTDGGAIYIVLGNDGYDAVSDWRADPNGKLWQFLDDWTEDTERFL